MSNKLFATLIMSAGLAWTALAHGGGEHVKGVVVSIQPQALVVKSEGKSVELMLMPSTVYEKSRKNATLKDLKVGDKVVVDVVESGDMMHANKVMFGPQPK